MLEFIGPFYRWRVGVLATLVGILLTAPLNLSAAPPSPRAQDDPVLYLKVLADSAARDQLAADGWDIAGYALDEGWVEVITNPQGELQLKAEGYSVERLGSKPKPSPLYDPHSDAPLPDQLYTSPAELETFLNQVAADHPDITHLEVIGTSVEGRPIYGMKISDNASTDENELSILFSGAHHAREVMSPEVVMDTIDQLTDLYGTDTQITDWVNAYEIWTVPMVNPDGVEIVHFSDADWRKNARDNDSDGDVDLFDGVDLNRNYEWGWGYQCRGSSSSTFSGTYRGTHEGSEPETQAMIELGRRYFPVFDVEYHSYGEDVFYATSCDPAFAPKLSTITGGSDQSISRVIAEGYSGEIIQADGGIGYTPAPYGSRVDGTGRDQQYFENGSIAFVTEINSSTEGGFRPDYTTYRDVTVEGHRPGWQWLLARMSGPAVGGVITDADGVTPIQADVSLDELSLPDGKRLTSRADTGRFHIIVVPGTYNLNIQAPGYLDYQETVVVGSDWVPLDISLTPEGGVTFFEEAFESDASTPWTVGDASDTASAGIWVLAEPHGSHSGDVQGNNLIFANPRVDATPGEGKRTFVTGNTLNTNISAADVDNGITSLISPTINLDNAFSATLNWWTWFRGEAADPDDQLLLEIRSSPSEPWELVTLLDATTETPDASPAWIPQTAYLDEVVALSAEVQLRFRAQDGGVESIVEAAVDDLTIHAYRRDIEGLVEGVRFTSPSELTWDAVPGRDGITYDVSRGDLSNLALGASEITLGPLTCIEENSTNLLASDASVPSPGEGWFYLVRFELGFRAGSWGNGSQGDPRVGTGGCSP